ncbi:MAG: zinc ribbon domain-containing protein [Firmicutes bacterium]|nr:zinc ribbon domain-containing protein [Bacillota bacterium]
MPIYEFKCLDCGTITEVLVLSLTRGEGCACGKCGGKKTEKIISRPVVRTGRVGGGKADDSLPGCGDSDETAPGCWPDNDDYVRLKGQQ